MSRVHYEDMFASIGYVIVDLRDMTVNASKITIPCSPTDCATSLWMTGADGFPIEKLRVVYRRFAMLVLRDSFLDSTQIAFLAERAGTLDGLGVTRQDGGELRLDEKGVDAAADAGEEESKGDVATISVDAAPAVEDRAAVAAAPQPSSSSTPWDRRRQCVVSETAQVVAEVLTHLSVTALAVTSAVPDGAGVTSDEDAPFGSSTQALLSLDANSRLLFAVSSRLRTEVLRRSYRRHWENVLGYSLGDHNEAKELLLALLTEDSTTSVVPDAVAADMFMLIQQHTHHWTTFLSVAPSNLESVIRRIKHQAAMVRELCVLVWALWLWCVCARSARVRVCVRVGLRP